MAVQQHTTMSTVPGNESNVHFVFCDLAYWIHGRNRNLVSICEQTRIWTSRLFAIVAVAVALANVFGDAYVLAYNQGNIVAPVKGIGAFFNESSRGTHGYGVNWFRSSRIRSLMSSTDEGRTVLAAADNGRINLTLEAGMNVPDLFGEMMGGIAGAPNEAIVYLLRTQNGRRFGELGRSVNGYAHSAATGIHEGLHALGINWSARAEALVRLAELRMHGIATNRSAIRQVLLDMRSAINDEGLAAYGSRIAHPDGRLGRTRWKDGWTQCLGNMEFKVVY